MEIVEETGRYNEIDQFQDARYVSASEAAWRILAFDIVDNYPPVYRLEMHTEGHHAVLFREGEELPAALRGPKTKLTEWFKANTKYPAQIASDTMNSRGSSPGIAVINCGSREQSSEGGELEELGHASAGIGLVSSEV